MAEPEPRHDRATRQQLGLPPIPDQSPSAQALQWVVEHTEPLAKIIQEHRRRISPGGTRNSLSSKRRYR